TIRIGLASLPPCGGGRKKGVSRTIFMHGERLTSHIQNGLGVYYLLVVLLNLGFAAYVFYFGRNKAAVVVGLAAAGVFLLHALAYFGHLGWMLPHGFRDFTTR